MIQVRQHGINKHIKIFFMVLQVNKDILASVAASGGILKSANNTIGSYIPSNLFDITGLLIIKGVGFISGGSNPGNTMPDELSIVFSRPNIGSPSTTSLFNKIFTTSFSSFEFEIKIAARSSASGDAYISIINQDGTVIQINLPTLNANTFYNIYFNHTTVSTLYSISIDSIMTEYKTFGN